MKIIDLSNHFQEVRGIESLNKKRIYKVLNEELEQLSKRQSKIWDVSIVKLSEIFGDEEYTYFLSKLPEYELRKKLPEITKIRRVAEFTRGANGTRFMDVYFFKDLLNGELLQSYDSHQLDTFPAHAFSLRSANEYLEILGDTGAWQIIPTKLVLSGSKSQNKTKI